MSTIVTALLYSGRPNPSWELTPEQETSLQGQLSAEKAQTDRMSPAALGMLGYRGFEIRTSGSTALPSYAACFDGVLDVLGSEYPNFVDEESGLESLLLETGQNALTDTEQQYIRGEIEKNVSGGTRNNKDRSDGFDALLAPPYEPSKWNNDPVIRRNNNCYNYANDKITNTFAQPGRGSGSTVGFPPDCADTGSAAQRDGQKPLSSPSSTPSRGHYIALVIWPGSDYHWYRRDDNGKWSHKPGQTPARNTDNSNQLIMDPETCDRGPYTVFCGYFHCIPDETTIL